MRLINVHLLLFLIDHQIITTSPHTVKLVPQTWMFPFGCSSVVQFNGWFNIVSSRAFTHRAYRLDAMQVHVVCWLSVPSACRVSYSPSSLQYCLVCVCAALLFLPVIVALLIFAHQTFLQRYIILSEFSSLWTSKQRCAIERGGNGWHCPHTVCSLTHTSRQSWLSALLHRALHDVACLSLVHCMFLTIFSC